MKKRKERNIDTSVYEDDSSDHDFNCAVIGGALKSLRRSHGKRQQEIAAILKVSVSAYSHYECGEQIPDLINLIRISNLYSINMSHLVLLTCIDIAKKNKMDISEVFLAYSHGRTLPPEATGIMSDCDQLDDNGRENLRLFLKSALSC